MTPKEGTTTEGTPKRQPGGQPGNLNAGKSLTRSKRLVLGSMPKRLKRVERSVMGLRRMLEADVEAAYGTITTTAAANIQSACRFEIASQLAARHLRLSGDTLDAKTRLAYIQAVAQNSASRDKCIRELRLDGAASNAISDYYSGALPVESSDVQLDQTDDNAADGRTESEEANADGP